MINRLRAMPWGWITIGLAYSVAVLPIFPQHRLVWLGIAVAMAYLVLARRATIDTAERAQSSDDQSIFALWRAAFRATLTHRALLALPFFSLMLAAQNFMGSTPESCPTLFRAYCMTYHNSIQIETLVLGGGMLGLFLLLDHGLLIALTLLVRKHLPKSAAFVGNTAVGLRFALACTVLSVVAVSVNVLEFSMYGYYSSQTTVTDRRALETIYPAFEPLVTNGIFLNANILNRPTYCTSYIESDYTRCNAQFDTRPFIARQMVSALLGMLMYSLLIIAVLRLTAPFSLRFSVAHAKAKRGPIDADAEIAYL